MKAITITQIGVYAAGAIVSIACAGQQYSISPDSVVNMTDRELRKCISGSASLAVSGKMDEWIKLLAADGVKLRQMALIALRNYEAYGRLTIVVRHLQEYPTSPWLRMATTEALAEIGDGRCLDNIEVAGPIEQAAIIKAISALGKQSREFSGYVRDAVDRYVNVNVKLKENVNGFEKVLIAALESMLESGIYSEGVWRTMARAAAVENLDVIEVVLKLAESVAEVGYALGHVMDIMESNIEADVYKTRIAKIRSIIPTPPESLLKDSGWMPTEEELSSMERHVGKKVVSKRPPFHLKNWDVEGSGKQDIHSGFGYGIKLCAKEDVMYIEIFNSADVECLKNILAGTANYEDMSPEMRFQLRFLAAMQGVNIAEHDAGSDGN